MYGVYLFADTDKHEQNQHPDIPGQSESVLIVELIDPTKLISRYSAKSPRYCSPTPAVLPLLAFFRLHPSTGPLPSPSSSTTAPFDAPVPHPRRPPTFLATVSYIQDVLYTCTESRLMRPTTGK